MTPGDILEGAICRRRQYRAAPPTRVSLWESAEARETTENRDKRHLQARILCRQCPVLDACEQRLSEMEAADIRIDGVVAARFSDVKVSWAKERQSTCRVCGIKLIAQAHAVKLRESTQVRHHVGKGLCSACAVRLENRKSGK